MINKRGWCSHLAFLVLILSSCTTYNGTPPQGSVESNVDRKTLETAIARVYPALVRISVITIEGDNGRLRKWEVMGSGVIISKDGYVVTNHHVAGKAKSLKCTLTDREEVEAVLVGTDALSDISVLKLKLDTRKKPGEAPPFATFGDSDSMKVGDVVFAMGSPMALSQSVTRGIVSNTALVVPRLSWLEGFRLDGEDIGTIVRWIGHDSLIAPGNSGGPLVNARGEIVGINEIQLGISGAIPGNLVKTMTDQIVKYGSVRRSWTGIECQPRLKELKADKGVLIGGVVKDSPAAKAGIRAGDIMFRYDGIDVNCTVDEDMAIINQLMLDTPIGKRVEIDVLREGKENRFSVTTTFRGQALAKDEEIKEWGITAVDFTMMSALEMKRPDTNGVCVASLRQGGPASEAKPSLEREDVILEVDRKPVGNIAEMRSVTEALTKDREDRVPVLVRFERNTSKYLTVVRIGKETREDSPAQAKKAWFPASFQVLTKDLAEVLNLKGETGIRITQVYQGYSAEKAGIKVGDVVLRVDGDPIEASHPEDVEVFPQMIRQRKIGSNVVLDIVRDGQRLKTTVPLEIRPLSPPELKHYKDADFEFTVRDLCFYDRIAKQIAPDISGVYVEHVEQAGWAALARLQADDIVLSIDTIPTPDVKTVAELFKKIKREKQARRIVFAIKRGIHSLYLEAEPAWVD
jgi:serine protease Do